MTNDPELTRAVHAFLEDGVDRMPDRVYRGAMDAVPSTRQRRESRSQLRLAPLAPLARAGGYAAAIVIVALGGIAFLTHQPGVGTVTPTPSPTPIVSSPPSSLPTGGPVTGMAVGTPLGAGTYEVGAPFAMPFSLSLPDSSRFFGVDAGSANFGIDQAPNVNDGARINLLLPEAVFPDPCHVTGSPLPVSTTDQLVTALRSMRGFTATAPVSTTVAGHPARSFVITNTIDTATAACTRGLMLPMFTYLGNADGAATNGGTRQVLWVVDVDGTPLIVVGDNWGDAGRAALDGLVATIRLR